jgi:hypothetical protein
MVPAGIENGIGHTSDPTWRKYTKLMMHLAMLMGITDYDYNVRD